MSKTDYLSIIKKAWNITWDNKFLWWFGLILALGSGGFNFNFPLNINSEKIENEKFIQATSAFLDRYWQWIITGVSLLFVLIIIIAVLKIISRAGLIKSVAELGLDGYATFKKGFNEGKKYFWKLLGLGLLISLFVIGIMVALFSPVVFLVYLKSYVWAAILGIIAFIFIIALLIIALFVREYSYLYLVLSGIGIRASLENAWLIFRKNFGPSIIFSLILIAMSIIFGFAVLFVILITSLLFLVIGLASNYFFAKTGIIIAVALGIAVLLAVILLLQSVFETFRQTAWVLFFKEIASVKDEEIVKEEEVVKAEKVLDAGEA